MRTLDSIRIWRDDGQTLPTYVWPNSACGETANWHAQNCVEIARQAYGSLDGVIFEGFDTWGRLVGQVRA